MIRGLMAAACSRVASGGGINPPWSAVALLLHGDASVADSSSFARSNTSGSNAPLIDTTEKKYGAGSLYFNSGGSRFLRYTDGTGLGIGTGDFTIEFWLNTTFDATGLSGSEPRLFAPASSADQSGGLQIWISKGAAGSANRVQLGSPTGGSVAIVSSVDAVNDGAWRHVAIVRASGVSKIFLDGVLKQSASDSNNYTRWGTEGLYMASWVGSGGYFTGRMDDVRITVGHARYSAEFTPPSAAFPDG